MSASLSEMLQYAQLKDQQQRSPLANFAYHGLKGFMAGAEEKRHEGERKVKTAQAIAELSKTLAETTKLQSEIQMTDNMLKAVGGAPLSASEREASSSVALDNLGPVVKKYIGINGKDRTTPITKSERIQSVADGANEPGIKVKWADEYDAVPTYRGGKWDISYTPRARVEQDYQKKQADIELTKARQKTEGERQRSLRKGSGGGGGGKGSSIAKSTAIRKLANDMAIREEVTRQKAAGTYIPETFKYLPTEDQVLKYMPAATKYYGEKPGAAQKEVENHLREMDPLGKFTNQK